MKSKIDTIQDILEEYRDCSSEMDSRKIAVEIDDMYHRRTLNCEPSYHHAKTILGVKYGRNRV